MLVPNARKLRAMSYVKPLVMVLKNSKTKRVLGNRGTFFLSKNHRKAMEDNVVNM